MGPVDLQENIRRRSAGYLPTMWKPELIKSYTSPYSHESHAIRLEELKKGVKRLITSTEEPNGKLKLINIMQRLGVSYHFKEEIKEILCHVYPNKIATDLYTVALQFRLLRENDFSIETDVFDKFLDKNGKFMENLSRDVTGLLSLYEASQLGMHGEDILKEAKNFSTKHLKSLMETLDSDIAEQVQQSLEVPLHWRMRYTEARNFINIYESDGEKSLVLLELAKLEYNLSQSVYLKELKTLAVWAKELNYKETLFCGRDRLPECYFMTICFVPKLQFTKCRRNLTKCAYIATPLDDLYDIYGSLDELEKLTDAVERWDPKAVDELPGCMKVCFTALHDHVNEMVQDAMADFGLDILPYIKEQWIYFCKSHLVEAQWFYNDYTPTFDEYMKNAWLTIGIPVTFVYCFFGVLGGSGVEEYIPECVENWFDSDIFYWASVIVRLLDDLADYKAEMERGEKINAIYCYMVQEDASEEKAVDHIRALITDAWSKLNKLLAHLSLPEEFVQFVLASLRGFHAMYQHCDWFSDQSKANKNGVILSLLEPIPIQQHDNHSVTTN